MSGRSEAFARDRVRVADPEVTPRRPSLTTRLPGRSTIAALLRRYPVLGQLAKFGAVSGLATVVNAAVYILLRTWWEPLAANLVALLVSTAISTEVNRRFTFGGVDGRRWRVGVQVAGTVVFYAFYSSAVLVIVAGVAPQATPLQEAMAVTAAGALGGMCRFLLLRNWVFNGRGPAARPGPRPGRARRTRRGRAASTAVAVLAGTALVLSSAGACDDGDTVPDVSDERNGGDDRYGGGDGYGTPPGPRPETPRVPTL